MCKKKIKWAVVDFIGGVALFFALGFIAIFLFQYVFIFPDGSKLWDMAEFFQQIEADPASHWWVLAMLFSTLIPTLLHAILGVIVMALFVPPFIPQWLAKKIELRHDGGHFRDVKIAITSICTLAVVVPLYVTYLIITTSFPFMGGDIIDTLIAAFKWYADLIGVF